MLTTTYTTRQGYTIRCQYADLNAARAALINLDAAEQRTREVAPTDSGDVRFNASAEADALRVLIAREERRATAHRFWRTTETLLVALDSRQDMRSEWDDGLYLSNERWCEEGQERSAEIPDSADRPLLISGVWTEDEVAILRALAQLVPLYLEYNRTY